MGRVRKRALSVGESGLDVLSYVLFDLVPGGVLFGAVELLEESESRVGILGRSWKGTG